MSKKFAQNWGKAGSTLIPYKEPIKKICVAHLSKKWGRYIQNIKEKIKENRQWGVSNKAQITRIFIAYNKQKEHEEAATMLLCVVCKSQIEYSSFKEEEYWQRNIRWVQGLCEPCRKQINPF